MTTSLPPTYFFNTINFNSSFYNFTSSNLSLEQANTLYVKRVGDNVNGVYTFNNNVYNLGAGVGIGTSNLNNYKVNIKDNSNQNISLYIDGSGKGGSNNTGFILQSNSSGTPYMDFTQGLGVQANLVYDTPNNRFTIVKDYSIPVLINQLQNNTFIGGKLRINYGANTSTIPSAECDVNGSVKCNILTCNNFSSTQTDYNNMHYPIYTDFNGNLTTSAYWTTDVYTTGGSAVSVNRFFYLNTAYKVNRILMRIYHNSGTNKPYISFRFTQNGATLLDDLENNTYTIKRGSGLVLTDTSVAQLCKITDQVEMNLDCVLDMLVYNVYTSGQEVMVDNSFTWPLVGSCRTTGSFRSKTSTLYNGFALNFSLIDANSTIITQYTIQYY